MFRLLVGALDLHDASIHQCDLHRVRLHCRRGSHGKVTLGAAGTGLVHFCRNWQALRWATAEFFMSSIDAPLLREAREGPQSYAALMRQSFPKLSQLEYFTQVQRSAMRRKLPRPRRFSPALIATERARWNRRRNAMRRLQHGAPIGDDEDIATLGMPDSIPMPLSIGQRVLAQVWTATLPTTPDTVLAVGCVPGTPCPGFILAVSQSTAEYCVEFDLPVLGRQMVADTDVAATGDREIYAPIGTLLAAQSRAPTSGDHSLEMIRQTMMMEKRVAPAPVTPSPAPLRLRLDAILQAVRERLAVALRYIAAHMENAVEGCSDIRMDLARLLILKQEVLTEIPDVVASAQQAVTSCGGPVPPALQSQLVFLTR